MRFQSLLFEAVGRTVNPVNGAVGLPWTGNWYVCQASVKEVVGFEGELVWDSSKPDGTLRKLMDNSSLAKLGWEPKILLSGIIKQFSL
ncbi:putative GDP-L-fucose synthase transcription factor AS2-LOB family [Helianthus anomalus]